MLFVDIEMPGINGFETLKAILQDSPDQYIVMISAHSTLENVKKAIEYGARGFIVKPYTGAKVRDILEKYTRDDSPLSSGPATAAKADTNTDNPETAIVDLVVESSV
jgi:response regulator of citrate/malate metabolism